MGLPREAGRHSREAGCETREAVLSKVLRQGRPSMGGQTRKAEGAYAAHVRVKLEQARGKQAKGKPAKSKQGASKQ